MTGSWWEDAFRAAYLEVYGHRDERQAAAEVAAMLPRLAAAPGPVVDAGCGAGRHLAALRAAGLAAVGFDLSPDLLAAAAARPGCRGRLARGDLRAPPLGGGCGAVLCLFTAFGYFDDADNAACLAAMARLLAPGGWLLLDQPDPAALAAGLVPDSQRRTAGGWLVRERRRLHDGRVEKEVEAQPPAAPPVRWRESVRLYDRAALAGLAAGAGLDLAEIGPGTGGGRLNAWMRARGRSR